MVGKSTGKCSDSEKEALRKKKISDSMKKHPNGGGYRQRSGRGKKCEFKGIPCDSSWELAFVIYCMDHGKKIERSNARLPYVFNGIERIYIPDFVVDGEMIEIKGYSSVQSETKSKTYPEIKVLRENDLQGVFEYVRMTYGENFIRDYGRDPAG